VIELAVENRTTLSDRPTAHIAHAAAPHVPLRLFSCTMLEGAMGQQSRPRPEARFSRARRSPTATASTRPCRSAIIASPRGAADRRRPLGVVRPDSRKSRATIDSVWRAHRGPAIATSAPWFRAPISTALSRRWHVGFDDLEGGPTA
jgi:hypothetical protein